MKTPVVSSSETTTTIISEVPTVDIDLGDYQDEMHVGETQLLYVTVLPLNATNQSIYYQSDNINVVTVNMMGRLTAVGVGESIVSVSAGGITRTFNIIVNEPVTSDPSQVYINVMDIEVSDYKEIIKVDETVDISATVLPIDATKPGITYTSSNPQVATINSSGRINGISSGLTIITIEADSFMKSLNLTVKLATQNIEINSTYLVLNESDTFQLITEVFPKNADQGLTYKAVSNDIITVTDSGIINALKPGSGSVIVSTWDASKVVTVIVNKNNTVESSDINGVPSGRAQSTNLNQEELAKKIAELSSDGEYVIEGSKSRIVTSAVLRELYGTEKKLIVKYPDYMIIIKGTDIKSVENELDTKITLTENSSGFDFEINRENHLPGRITIQLLIQMNLSHLYLYSEVKSDFEEINTIDSNNRFTIDTNGMYRLTDKTLARYSMSWTIIAIIGTVGTGLIIIYIVIKKRHWFW